MFFFEICCTLWSKVSENSNLQTDLYTIIVFTIIISTIILQNSTYAHTTYAKKLFQHNYLG